MSKLQAKTTKQKIEYVVNNQLPSFASRYFNNAKDELTELSLYGYALDLASFFKYLQDAGIISINKMTLHDLNNISSFDIEEYLISSRTYVIDGVIKERKAHAINRRYFALQSFFRYYLNNDMIENYPVVKVSPPKIIKKPRSIPSLNDNMALISYISSGDMPTSHASHYQKHTRKRDTLLVVFMSCIGLKASECINLNIQDVYLEQSYIYVKNRSCPKVYVSSSISILISDYLSERLNVISEYGHDDALFLSLQKRRMNVATVQKLLKKYSSILFGDNGNIRSKDLCFSYRNTVFNNMKSISKTAELTGWSPETVFKVYEADLTQRLSEDTDIFEYN